MPSSYATEHTLPPITTTETVYPDGRKGMRAQGSYAWRTVQNSATLNQFVAYQTVITPSDALVFGPRLVTIAGLFQMYKVNSLTVHWIRNCGLDFPGAVISAFADGTDVTNQWPTTLTYQDVSQRDNPQPSSVNIGHNLTVKGKGTWLYITDDTGDGLEPKWFADMTFGSVFYNIPLVPTGGPATDLGHFFFTFDIEFRGNMEIGVSFNSLMKRKFFSIFMRAPQYNFSRWISYMWNISKKMAETVGSLTKTPPSQLRLVSSSTKLESELNAVSSLTSHFTKMEGFLSHMEKFFQIRNKTSKGYTQVSYSTDYGYGIDAEHNFMHDPWIESSFNHCRDRLIKEESSSYHSGKDGGVAYLRHQEKLRRALSQFVTPEQYSLLVAYVIHFFAETDFIVQTLLSDSSRVHKLLSEVLLWIYRRYHPKMEFELIEPHSDDDIIDDDIEVHIIEE